MARKPRLEPRNDPLQRPANPLVVGVGYAFLAELLADSSTSWVDRAAFVATPFVITAAANYGARAGVSAHRVAESESASE